MAIRLPVLVCVVVLGFADVARTAPAEVIKLPAILDVGVSSHPDEINQSKGNASRLKIKNIEAMVLLNFDLRRLRGKRIQAAWLHMRTDPESARRELARLQVPAPSVDLLRHIGVSTIGSSWVEGAASAFEPPEAEGHGATFAEASRDRTPWAWKGSTLADVIMGNTSSVHSHAALVREADAWWKVPVDPAVVETLLAGGGYGLCVMDETGVGGELGANNVVFTRESHRWVPYLTIEVGETDTEGPAKPTDLAASPAPEMARLDRGAVRVQVRVPAGCMALQLYADGRRLEPWEVPRPGRAGELQTFCLTDFPPRFRFRLEVAAADGAGNVSDRVSVEAVASPALVRPRDYPLVPFRPRGAEPSLIEGRMRLWAFPEGNKVDPVTGDLLDEPDHRGYRAANAIWDGARRRVRLVAARGEIVGFQIAVERAGPSLSKVRVEPGPLRGAVDTIAPERFRLWRAWYIKSGGRWHAEIALPHDNSFAVPAADNRIPGQRNQTVWIDVAVPSDARAGRYEGTVAVSAEGLARPAPLDVELHVVDVEIPATPGFWPELNSYAPPGEPGSDYFYDAHRLAHYHRCTINTVPYSQRGAVRRGFAPRLAGEGAGLHVADWTAFDRTFGPLLDGSAFADNPRAGVPVQVFYLPFCENWPVPIAPHYAFKGRPGRDTVVLHGLQAPRVEDAFDRAYREGWIAVGRQFAAHFREKGWNRTFAQCYLNNKWQFGGSSWWRLDEPLSRDDFLALRFFGRLWKEAVAGSESVRMLFRADVSRPQWQFDLFDGLVGIEYVNREIFKRRRTDQALAARMPAVWCVYGSCNAVGESNLQTAAWCLRAYVAGCEAVLPWSAVDGEGDSLRRPNANGLIVNGRSLGYGPLASFRVFALRRGAQDVEILRLLARQQGWTPEQMGLLVERRIPLRAGLPRDADDEAAAARFEGLTARQFVELKEAVLYRIVGR